uniref:Uncharacterized protein n=1 Tax=Tanacetum cinerariifolium TaxID=118510 RepID=A0A6L2M5N9_TANCI|nr:hypothetical protein [Tanacetum cinerariifolium]
MARDLGLYKKTQKIESIGCGSICFEVFDLLDPRWNDNAPEHILPLKRWNKSKSDNCLIVIFDIIALTDYFDVAAGTGIGGVFTQATATTRSETTPIRETTTIIDPNRRTEMYHKRDMERGKDMDNRGSVKENMNRKTMVSYKPRESTLHESCATTLDKPVVVLIKLLGGHIFGFITETSGVPHHEMMRCHADGKTE